MSSLQLDPGMIRVGDRLLALKVRRSPRAKRLILRLSPDEEALLLTLPAGVTRDAGLAFVRRQEGWIHQRLAALPDRVAFAEGVRLPLLGEEHEIRHAPTARRGVWREPGCLWVSGDADHLPRRVGDFLRAEARDLLRARAREKWSLLPAESARPLRRVSVRDTTSRWGSCSPAGNLNFSWRLIFVPEPVFDYVVAHEVAHLVHMNHSAAFWKLNDSLTPEMRTARRWLKEKGASLLRYG